MDRLDRGSIKELLESWIGAWDRHDLDGVLDSFSGDIIFENWTGIRVEGKEKLRNAWKGWFDNHQSFRFVTEDIFIDEEEQKALFMWRYEGPSFDARFEKSTETRRGVDVLYFRGGKICRKLTYSRTVIDLDGRRIGLIIP